MIWTVPNILTMARIAAAPTIALVFVPFPPETAAWLALGLFVAAALTDFLDGWLARRLGQVSDIGKMLDPIADKAMVVIALALILAQFRMDPLLVVPVSLILLREIVVSGLREHLGQVALSVTRLAKYKTAVQMVAIAVLLGWYALSLDPLEVGMPPGLAERSERLMPLRTAGIVLLWAAAVLTVLSGLDYLRKAVRYVAEREAMR